MRIFQIILVSVLLLGCSPEAVQKVETPVWVHEISDIPVAKDVRYGQLANGMRYAIYHNEKPDNQVVYRLRIQMGSIHEADDQRGLAHFIEHMAFNGSKNVPEGEMVKLLEREGLAFGADTNAYTSYNETVYKLNLPENDEALLETGLFLFREIADKLSFETAAIKRERGVVLSEYRRSETPAQEASKAGQEFMFPLSLLTSRPPIGEPDVISNAPRERFLDLYNRYYKPERSLLVVVGDVDVDAMVARLQASFGDWQASAKPITEPDPGQVQSRALEALVFQHKELPTNIVLRSHLPPVLVTDTDASRRQGIGLSLANAIINRRLSELSRASDASFLGARVSGRITTTNPDELSAGGSIALVTPPETWQQGLAITEQELRRALQYGFSQNELDEQISKALAGLKNAVERMPTR